MIRKRLTYANVASTLALVLALSGAAYAVSVAPNSVGTRQLKDGAVKTPKLADGAVTTQKVRDSSLRLHDLGGEINDGTASLSSTLNVPADGCVGVGLTTFNPAPKGFIGSLVVGYLTDDKGDAVMDNGGFVVPTMISETSQGGAVANLLVCDSGSGGQSVPSGSVFHYRVIRR